MVIIGTTHLGLVRPENPLIEDNIYFSLVCVCFHDCFAVNFVCFPCSIHTSLYSSPPSPDAPVIPTKPGVPLCKSCSLVGVVSLI